MKTKITSRIGKLLFLSMVFTFFVSTATAYATDCYFVGDASDLWENSNNWASASGGVGGTCAATGGWPGASVTTDVAIFDGQGDAGNVDITTTGPVNDLAGIQLLSGYTQTVMDPSPSGNYGSSGIIISSGTFIPNSSLPITVAGNFTMTGGEFDATGGTGDVTINGTFLQSGGIFTQDLSYLWVKTNFQLSSSGVFTNSAANIRVDGTCFMTGGTFTGASSGSYTLTVNSNTTFSGATVNFNSLNFTAGNGLDTLYVSAGNVNLGSGTVLIKDHLDLSGTANLTASSLTMTLQGSGNFYQHGGTFNGNAGTLTIGGVMNINSGTFNHGNNTIYHLGSSITGPVTVYTFYAQYPGATYTVSGSITVENDLYYQNGYCSGNASNKFIIKKDFNWASADGGNCYIEFNPTIAKSYFFFDGDDYPVLFFNSSNASIEVDNEGDVSMEGLVIAAGTVNQGPFNITINGGAGPGYKQSGGSFVGGTGSLTVTQGWSANTITSGSFSSGSGAVSFTYDVQINFTGTKDAVVSFDGASQVDFLRQASFGAVTGAGEVTFTENTTNFSDTLSITSGANIQHNDGTVVYKGDNLQATGTFHNFTVDPNDAGDSIYHSGTITVANNLNWTDGKCTTGGVYVVQNEFSYTTTSTGSYGDCQVQLTSSGTETVNIPGGKPFMKLLLNSATTTVNMTGSGTTPFKKIEIQTGIFNQGSVDVTSAEDFTISGGTYTGGSGNLAVGSFASFNLNGGTFTAGSGDIATTGSNRNLVINTTGSRNAVVDLSASDHVDTYNTIIGATGSGGSVKAPGASSNYGWTVESTFNYNDNDTTFDPNGGTITMDGTYTPSYIYASQVSLNNLKVNKTDTTDIARLGTALDINGSIIVVKGVLNLDSKAVNLAEDFAKCPSADISDTDCNNATPGDATLTPGTTVLTLDGSNQTIYGDNTGSFYDLIKVVTSPDTIYFEGGEEVHVTHQLTLTGTSGNILAVKSTDTAGHTPAELNADAGMTVDYVTIEDVNNTRGSDYDLSSPTKGHAENLDLGFNNTGWIFDVHVVPEFSTYMLILTMLVVLGMLVHKRRLLLAK